MSTRWRHRRAAAPQLPCPQINTTPLVDVLLVLLVMLIVTLPLRLDALPASLRAAPAAPARAQRIRVIDVEIGADGRVRWNARPVASQAALLGLLHDAAAQRPQPRLRLHPSPRAPYAAFVRVLAAAQHEGLGHLGVVQRAPPRP